MKRKRKNRLPRVTILGMSSAELLRFAESIERVATAAGAMIALSIRLEAALVRLEHIPTPRRRRPAAATETVPDGQGESQAAEGPADTGNS